ncbi:MAG: alpha/beta hydrolase-fold protein [Alphaproteobacteria bacterium]|nr:alpha/beta hydrolase-fold protein [Alphaproteobacteria bacterium]
MQLIRTALTLALACALAPAFAPSAAALDGKLVHVKIVSANVPGPVDLAIYTPPGYDPKRAEPYPLIVQLHGGGGSSQNMTTMAETLETAIEEGLVPASVSVMPSVGRSFYMDYRDGSQKWETFIVSDLLAHMRAGYAVPKGREGTLITGISMGGMGSLRIALKHPDKFHAVAGMEPGIEPVLAYADIQTRDRFWRNNALFEEIYGKPVDAAYWAANNPATIVTKDPARLKGLGIYLEAGDQDMFFLHHGTEFLHRALFDGGVSHEYRLVKGAEHTGPSIAPRVLDALTFFGRILDPPEWISAPVTAARARIDGMKTAGGYPITPHDPQTLRTE